MKRPPYRNYLLTVLALILAFNYVDRQALGLLLQDIKVDLSLSDTQLGFLTGVAFALFYSVLGIPIGRWADRGNRVTIISITTVLWSAAVALCGVAGNFLQLLLIRVGVAVGEAGCMPPAHSLIADYFTRGERPQAIARYMLGGQLSIVIGFFLAGWLNQSYGWRMTFVILGLPGLGLGMLARLTLKEPRREKRAEDTTGRFATPSLSQSMSTPLSPPQPSLAEVCMTLWTNATFRHMLLCLSVTSFFGAGIWQWLPAFFIRSYGLKTGELGTWFAAIVGLGGIAGTYLGGELASRHAAGNERLQLRCMAMVYVIFAAVSACIYLSSNRYTAFALMGLTAVGFTTVTAPYFATIQTLVPDRMRAVAIAFIYLFTNLVGLGLGPLAAGALSDVLRPRLGDESLRYALLALSPGYLWGAWHLWRASRTVTRDLEAVQIAHDCVAWNKDDVVNTPTKTSVA